MTNPKLTIAKTVDRVEKRMAMKKAITQGLEKGQFRGYNNVDMYYSIITELHEAGFQIVRKKK